MAQRHAFISSKHRIFLPFYNPRMNTPILFRHCGLLLTCLAFSGLRAGAPPVTAQLKVSDDEITALAAAPAGTLLLVAGETLTLVDLAGGRQPKKFSGVGGGTQRAALFSADGQRIYGASSKGMLVSGAASGVKIERKVKAHDGEINALALSPDGKWLASGGEDKLIKFWDAATFAAGNSPGAMPATIQSLVFSPNGGELAAAGDDGAIIIFNLKTGARQTPIASGDTVNALAWSPDGKLLASAGNSDQIQLWNPATGKLAHGFPRQSSWVSRLLFMPDGHRIAALSADKTLRIFRVDTGELLEGFTAGGDDDVTALALLADGTLVTGGRDEAVKRWVPKPTGN